MSTSAIERAIRDAQDVLWDNVPPTEDLTDEAIVGAIHAIVSAPRVQIALETASDTVLVFVLRSVNRIVSDQSIEASESLSELWHVLADPDLYRLLGVMKGRRIEIGPKKPPARRP